MAGFVLLESFEHVEGGGTDVQMWHAGDVVGIFRPIRGIFDNGGIELDRIHAAVPGFIGVAYVPDGPLCGGVGSVSFCSHVGGILALPHEERRGVGEIVT